MKVVMTSDNHGHPFRIPECDVFVHAGDLTAFGTLKETKKFARWLRTQTQVGQSIIVPGNHDRCYEQSPAATAVLFAGDKVAILNNSGIEIDGINFWGSAYTPPFFNWAFMAEEDELQLMYTKMPQEIDILITHGPPRGILDPGYLDPHVGSKALLGAVMDPARKIRHHVFGHLHAAGGMERTFKTNNGDFETTFHNVSACNEAYAIKTEPKVIEI